MLRKITPGMSRPVPANQDTQVTAVVQSRVAPRTIAVELLWLDMPSDARLLGLALAHWAKTSSLRALTDIPEGIHGRNRSYITFAHLGVLFRSERFRLLTMVSCRPGTFTAARCKGACRRAAAA
jgi:hypothetical protein